MIRLNFNFCAADLMWAGRWAGRGHLWPETVSLTLPDALLRCMCCEGYWFSLSTYAFGQVFHASPLCADINPSSRLQVHTSAYVAAAAEKAVAAGRFVTRCMCVGNHRPKHVNARLLLWCERSNTRGIAFFEQPLSGVVFTSVYAPDAQHAAVACLTTGADSVSITGRRVRKRHIPDHCCAWERRAQWAAACVAASLRSQRTASAMEQLLTDHRLCRARGPNITSFVAGSVLLAL